MYLVAGNNLFGQWLKERSILDNFDQIPLDIFKHTTEFPCVSWSYNITKQKNYKLYVIGSWNGVEKQIQEIVFPDKNVNVSDLVINGNDYHLIFINKKPAKCESDSRTEGSVQTYIETQKWKDVNLVAETPVNIKRKKLNGANKITVSVCNDTILYLTDSGDVYNGLLPSYVDTSDCVGNVIDVKCGYEHNVILTDEGMVYTWGNGRRLQLGHGDVTITEVPTLVEALSGIKIIKIAAGGWHSMALSEFGDIYAWGWNDNGQLGIFNEEMPKIDPLKSYAVPTIVDFFKSEKLRIEDVSVRDIACGSKHSVALLNDGTVWVTGNNKYGQLGLNVKKHPVINYFKQCVIDEDVCVDSLKCGTWTTILITKSTKSKQLNP